MKNHFIEDFNAIVSLQSDISKISNLNMYINNLNIFIQKQQKHENEISFVATTKKQILIFDQRKCDLDPKNITDNTVKEWISEATDFVNKHIDEINKFTEITKEEKDEVIQSLNKLLKSVNEYKRINDKEIEYDLAKDEIKWSNSFIIEADKILCSYRKIGSKLVVAKDLFISENYNKIEVNMQTFICSDKNMSKNNRFSIFENIKILSDKNILIINKVPGQSTLVENWLNNFDSYLTQIKNALYYKNKLPEEFIRSTNQKISQLDSLYKQMKEQRDRAIRQVEVRKDLFITILLKVAIPLLWSLPIIALLIGSYFFMTGEWTQVAPQWLMRHNIPWYVFMWWGKGGTFYFIYAAPAFIIESLVFLIGNFVLAVWFLFTRVLGILFYVLYFTLPLIISAGGGFFLWNISSGTASYSEFDMEVDGAKTVIFIVILVIAVIVTYSCLGTVGSLGQMVRWR